MLISLKLCVGFSIFDSVSFLLNALSDLRQFSATESPLKVVKNAFCFASKSLSVLIIFKLLSSHFNHITKRLDKKDKIVSNFMT